jgi:multidrug efflux system outer membrane protein
VSVLRRSDFIRSSIGATAAVVLALGLSGCRSMAPPYSRPAPPVPDSYEQSPAPATLPASAIAWRDYFTDPRLQSLIERALDNNRDLRAAVLRVEEARALYRIERADQFPTIGVGGIGVHGDLPDNGPISESLTANGIAIGAGVAAWEIDFWGRVRSLKDAALEGYLATDAASRAAGLSIIAEVASDYVTLRELDERIALARRTLSSREDSLRIFTRRVQVGSTSRFERTQVEILRHQAAALVTELELARAIQAHALDLVVGAPSNLLPISASLDETAMFMELEPGLPSDLLTQRPDIVAAEHSLKSLNADIGAARAAFFPSISLTSFLGLASPALEELFDDDSGAWVAVPAVLLPIFDAGRRRANVDLAEVRREEAVSTYERAIQTAFREVADALSARRWLAEQVGVLQAAAAAHGERARLAKLSYDRGKVAYLDVLDAERGLLTAQQDLVRARGAVLNAHVDLYAALGGGSEGFTAPRPPIVNP